MKFKLDENLGERGRLALEAEGHDVATVPSQSLCSASDENLFSACADEERALVTLDLDFANPLRFPPEDSAGLVVLRLPTAPSSQDVDSLMRVLIRGLAGDEPLPGNLWIVEPGRIRVYTPDS